VVAFETPYPDRDAGRGAAAVDPGQATGGAGRALEPARGRFTVPMILTLRLEFLDGVNLY
jgi:hypothetical protein